MVQSLLPFPLRVLPLPGELLRSYVIRIAHAHGEKIQSFGYRLVGRGRQLFGDDLDRGRWTVLLQRLVARTGVPDDRLVAMTLRAYEGVLFGDLAPNGPARWVLHVGELNSHRRWSGLQYCPACLADDAEPYFRLEWRLAFSVWCDQHSIRLHDRCPDCQELVVVHRLDVGNRAADGRAPLLLCASCGHDRRASPRAPPPVGSDLTLTMQRQLLDTARGATLSAPLGDQHPLAYFAGMSILWSLLDDRKRSRALWEELLGDEIDWAARIHRRGGIERLGVDERARLLKAVAALLRDGVDGLVDSLARAGISSDKVLRYAGRERGRPPFWLWQALHLKLDRTIYVPSDGEIDAAIEHLRGRSDSGFVKIRSVCALLGMKTSNSARVAARLHAKQLVRVRSRSGRAPAA